MKDVTIDVNQLISRVEETTASVVHTIPEGYRGICPAHDDTSKSLRILESGDNGYQISCMAGCPTDSILESLGYSQSSQTLPPLQVIPKPVKNKTSLRVVGLNDFLGMDLPKKEMILAPFLTTQGIVLIYAKRGVGKTHLSLGIAHAIASGGSFLKWKAETPKRVLFVDGEMTGADIQDRLKRITLAANTKAVLDENFQIITPDLQTDSLPNLSRKEGRELIDGYLETFDVLILDNLSSLFRSSFENEADSWQEIQDWLLNLRRKGKSIVIIHHAGKSGQQRGTSKREDVADTVICLKNPEGYSPEEGAHFEVHFEKTRHFSGPDATPFFAKLVEADDGLWYWEVSSTEGNHEIEAVADGVKQGLTIQQIVELTGLSKSQVETRKMKARSLGLIN